MALSSNPGASQQVRGLAALGIPDTGTPVPGLGLLLGWPSSLVVRACTIKGTQNPKP